MSRLLKLHQKTNTPYLNYYEMEVEDRKGNAFSYYMASRAKNPEDLKMNTLEKPDRPDGVTIYSLYGEKRDRVVLVRQYRYTLGDYIYEFPAGLVEPGEDFHRAAMYEKPFYTTIGMTDECCSMVFGQASGTVSRDGLEDTEDLDVVLADRAEIQRILREERVAVMCAYMLMHFLQEDADPFGFLGKR